ncbi:MAG: NADH-ubiquinone oxidoreductase-F iron-sulfur binding region domain-containing protein, partial [Oscillospiraceae bacterium]|nr:NADH-ubiquinone oxidoreductase-F iron-sulfur binding region domain-containing protein [Oscillospiraceae bacterium]
MVTLSKPEIFMKAAEVREFGVYNEPLMGRWVKVIEERGDQDTPICAVAALNNADTDKALLELVRLYPREIMEGLDMAAVAVEAEEKVLVLPEGCEELGNELAALAAEHKVTVEYGIVNVRQYRGSAIHHVETMIALAQTAAGCYEPGTYVAVKKDGKVGELKKVPYGTTVAEVVGDTAGIKAFALGRTLYAPDSFQMPINADTNIGNGVITLYPDTCCLIHEAVEVLMDSRRQSCGKCTFCREGLVQLYSMTEEMTKGMAKREFIDMMTEIGEAMTFSTPCSVGQTGSAFTLSSMKLFMDEYDDHIKRTKCKNNVCSAFMSIYIDPSLCTGCEDCVDVCPADCIDGKAGFIHMIDSFDCTKCGK